MTRAHVMAVTAVAFLSAATPAGAAVFIGTQIVDTRIQGTIAGDPLDASDSDAGTRPGTITATAQVFQQRPSAPGGPAGVRGVSSVIASLTGTERGRVTFRRTLSATGDGALTDASDYIYFFSADTPTAFDVNWGVSAYGMAAGGQAPAQVAFLRERDTGEELLRTDPLGDGANGTTGLLLLPGRYELRIEDVYRPGANAASPSGGLSSQYSFSFRAVPEPAGWAMMTLGFGIVGAALRRRRRRACAA